MGKVQSKSSGRLRDSDGLPRDGRLSRRGDSARSKGKEFLVQFSGTRLVAVGMGLWL